MSGPKRLKGQPFDSSTIRHQLVETVDSVVAQGFLTASATAQSAVLTDSGITLKIETISNGRLIWGHLRNLGESRLTAVTLDRIGRLPSGNPANPSDLDAVQRRLLQTGYVEAMANPVLRKVPRMALADGVVRLQDLPSSFLEAAASWSRGQSTQGYVETRLANLWGTARDLDFGISQGEQGIRAHAHWKEPWLGSLDARLDLSGNLAYDSFSQALEGRSDLVWSLLEGRLEVGVGLSAASRSDRILGDTLFGPQMSEFGSRTTLAWRRLPPAIWPVGDLLANLDLEAVRIESDTGTFARIRVRTGSEIWPQIGPVDLRFGFQARAIWPLDRTAGLSEAIAPGGIAGWRGWPEGSPRSPSWGWLVTQAGVGSRERGGVYAFWEPGVRALRTQDQSWVEAWGWSEGVGMSLVLPTWQIDLVVAGRDDTRTWQDALLQVRARNRF